MATENELPVGSPALVNALLPLLGDPAFCSDIGEDPKKALNSRGMTVQEGCEVRAVRNSADTFHFVFPPDPNTVLDDETLAVVAGGKTASSGASAGSLSTAATAPSCASTGSSASSASSAASAVYHDR